jgi:hypothetical protein
LGISLNFQPQLALHDIAAVGIADGRRGLVLERVDADQLPVNPDCDMESLLLISWIVWVLIEGGDHALQSFTPTL